MSTKALDKIQEFIGNSGNVVNKVKLFDNEFEKAEYVSKSKIIVILVNYGQTMEKILKEMRMIFAG